SSIHLVFSFFFPKPGAFFKAHFFMYFMEHPMITELVVEGGIGYTEISQFCYWLHLLAASFHRFGICFFNVRDSDVKPDGLRCLCMRCFQPKLRIFIQYMKVHAV